MVPCEWSDTKTSSVPPPQHVANRRRNIGFHSPERAGQHRDKSLRKLLLSLGCKPPSDHAARRDPPSITTGPDGRSLLCLGCGFSQCLGGWGWQSGAVPSTGRGCRGDASADEHDHLYTEGSGPVRSAAHKVGGCYRRSKWDQCRGYVVRACGKHCRAWAITCNATFRSKLIGRTFLISHHPPIKFCQHSDLHQGKCNRACRI